MRMGKTWQKRKGEQMARENARAAKKFIAKLDKPVGDASPACKRWVSVWVGKTDPIFERVLTEFWHTTRSCEKSRTVKVGKLAAYWERLTHSVRTRGQDVVRTQRYYAVLPVISWVANACGRRQVTPTGGADFVYRLEAWADGKLDVDEQIRKHVPYGFIVTNTPHVTVIVSSRQFEWVPADIWHKEYKGREHGKGKAIWNGTVEKSDTGVTDENEVPAIVSQEVVNAEQSGVVSRDPYVATADVFSQTTFSFYPTIKNRMGFANKKAGDMSEGDLQHAERVTSEVRAEPDKSRRKVIKRTARAVSIAKRYKKDKSGKPVLGKNGMPVGEFTGWVPLDYDREKHGYLTDQQFQAVYEKAVEVSRGTAFKSVGDGFCVPLWIGISRDDFDFEERARKADRWLCDRLNTALHLTSYIGHGMQVDPASLSPNLHRYVSKEFVEMFRRKQ